MAVPTIPQPWRNSRSSSRTWKERRRKPQGKNSKKKMMTKSFVRNKKDGLKKIRKIKKTGFKREKMKLQMTLRTPVISQATWVMILTMLSPRSRKTSMTSRDTPGKERIDRGRYGRNYCCWDGSLMPGLSDSHSSASSSSFGFGIYMSTFSGTNGGLKATFSWWATHYTFGHNPWYHFRWCSKFPGSLNTSSHWELWASLQLLSTISFSSAVLLTSSTLHWPRRRRTWKMEEK